MRCSIYAEIKNIAKIFYKKELNNKTRKGMFSQAFKCKIDEHPGILQGII